MRGEWWSKVSLLQERERATRHHRWPFLFVFGRDKKEAMGRRK
jgi:hypothetical protein